MDRTTFFLASCAAGRRNLQLNVDGKQKEGRPEEEEVTACTMAQRKRKHEFIITFQLLFFWELFIFCLFLASERLYKEKSAVKQLNMKTVSNEMKNRRKAKQTALTWRLKRERDVKKTE